jgi:hypothetical protein
MKGSGISVMAAAAALFATCPMSAGAQDYAFLDDYDYDVDVELVLAVDISYSVDEEEARRQREGYVAALASQDVIRSIQGGPLGRIAVTYVEWADSGFQRAAADWTVIASEEDALEFAARVAAAPLERGHYTAIGAAIVNSVERIESNAHSAPRRIIDISGDGPQNQGLPLADARRMADNAGVVVNGLPVISADNGRWVRPVELHLDDYFQENVIAGPGAFVLPARTEAEFREAILRKLVIEIAGALPSPEDLDRPWPSAGELGRAP